MSAARCVDFDLKIHMPDDTMAPRYKRGDVLYLLKDDPLEPDDDVAVEIADGSFRVFRFLRETEHAIEGATYNPPQPVTQERASARSVYRVLLSFPLKHYASPRSRRAAS